VDRVFGTPWSFGDDDESADALPTTMAARINAAAKARAIARAVTRGNRHCLQATTLFLTNVRIEPVGEQGRQANSTRTWPSVDSTGTSASQTFEIDPPTELDCFQAGLTIGFRRRSPGLLTKALAVTVGPNSWSGRALL